LDQALAAEPTYRPALALKAAALLTSREIERAADLLTRLAADDLTDLKTCGLAMFALNVLGGSSTPSTSAQADVEMPASPLSGR
jgi:hypothetical protein